MQRGEHGDPEINRRYYWAEAEVFVYKKLREGVYPSLLGDALHVASEVPGWSHYALLFVLTASRIVSNMGKSGMFRMLPTYEVFDEIMATRSPKECRAYLSMMQLRFEDIGELRKNGVKRKFEEKYLRK
jgi:hypothetical protein